MRSAMRASLAITALVNFATAADAADLKTVYDFCPDQGCPDGLRPNGISIDTAGTIYGTTSGGGAHNAGLVYD